MTATPEASSPGLLVLVTDDARQRREVLGRTLADALGLEAGFEVALAGSADEALEVLRARTVDVLLTDHHVAGTSGLVLVAQARQLQLELHAILLYGPAQRQVILDAIEDDRVGRYIAEPWQPATLIGAVKHALEAAGVRRELDALLARLERRLHTMSTLVELFTDANAPPPRRARAPRARPHRAVRRRGGRPGAAWPRGSRRAAARRSWLPSSEHTTASRPGSTRRRRGRAPLRGVLFAAPLRAR